jgi:hypothetical protein
MDRKNRYSIESSDFLFNWILSSVKTNAKIFSNKINIEVDG